MTMIQWSEVAQSLIDHQGNTEEVLREFNLQTLPKFLKAVAGKNRK